MQPLPDRGYAYWPPYAHPDRAPLPDRAAALAAPMKAFPSWIIEVGCSGCGHHRHANTLRMPARLLNATMAEVVQAIRRNGVRRHQMGNRYCEGGPIRYVSLIENCAYRNVARILLAD